MPRHRLITALGLAAAVVIVTQEIRIARLRRLASVPPAESPAMPRATDPASPQPGSATGPTAAAPSVSALRDALARHGPQGRLAAILDLAARLPGDGLAEAIAALQETGPDWDPDVKFALHLLLTRLGTERPDDALAALDSLGPKHRGERASSLLAGLAAADPARAAAWLAAPDNKLVDFPMMGHIMAGTVGKEWVRRDPDAAVAWAAALPENQRAGAYVGILGTLAAADPRRAAGIAVALEPGDARRHILGDIGEAWARVAPADAMAWVRTLDAADRPAALRDALSGWAVSDPAAAARSLASLPPDEITGPVLKAVAEPWTLRDPAAAAAWVMSQPDPKARDEAIGAVAWNWTRQDPVAASTWLKDQPPGPAKDAAIGGLALAAFDNDPAGAVTWATQLSDDRKRGEALQLGLTEWQKRDAAAADAWARRNGVALPAPGVSP